jgi:hypothetical protein
VTAQTAPGATDSLTRIVRNAGQGFSRPGVSLCEITDFQEKGEFAVKAAAPAGVRLKEVTPSVEFFVILKTSALSKHGLACSGGPLLRKIGVISFRGVAGGGVFQTRNAFCTERIH